jgi:outer membrane protein TolC
LFSSTGLTAEQAATRAHGVSPAVRRSAAEVEAAFAEAATAELARVPQIGGKASYVRNSALPPLSFGATTIEIPNNYYTAQAQLTVPLSEYVVRFPKLIDAAKYGVEAAKASKAKATVAASHEARLAYYEWLRSRLQVLIAQRQLVQVEATHRQVKALTDVQRLSKAELLRVESQRATAEQTLDQLSRLSELREEQLRLLIGAAVGEPLAIGEDVRTSVVAPQPQNLDAAIQQAVAKRLDVRVLQKGIAAKTHQRQAELAGALPRLSAFAVADYANPNQRIFPLKEEFKFTWSAGVQLTWTLNDALISNAARRRLAAETDELRADYDSLLRGARLEILSAQQAVLLALHAAETSNKGLIAAEEGYRVRKALLAADRATAVELVDSETELTRARIASLNARVDLRVALVQLRHALGEDVVVGH